MDNFQIQPSKKLMKTLKYLKRKVGYIAVLIVISAYVFNVMNVRFWKKKTWHYFLGHHFILRIPSFNFYIQRSESEIYRPGQQVLLR